MFRFALALCGVVGVHAELVRACEPSTAPDTARVAIEASDARFVSDEWTKSEQQPWLELLPPVEEELSAGLGIDEPEVSEPSATRFDAGGLGDPSRAPLRVRLSWLPSSTLKSGTGSVSLTHLQMTLAFPLRIQSDGIWLGMFGVRSLEVVMNDVPASVAAPLPDRFWDISLGVMRIKQWEGGNKSGAMILVGSPSDQPFAALRDVTVSVLAFLQVPHSERNAWEFSLFYSPTGQIVFPLPGIAYRWHPSERFQAQIGVPTSFTCRPTDVWTFRGQYRPLNQVQLEAVRHLGPAWDGFARFDTVSDAFFQADRIENQERTYFFDQRLSLGVRRRLIRGWSLETSAAYVFDRKIFDAESFSRGREHVMSLDPTIGGGLSLSWER